MTPHPLLTRIGESDCEVLHRGLITQPVNTISSLAFTAVGLWLMVRGIRRPPGRRIYPVVLGVSLTLVGLGSVAFHGPQYAGSRWLHDETIATAVLFVVAYDIALARGWPPGRMLPVYLASIVGVGIVLGVTPDSSNAVLGLLVVLAVAAEISLRRLVQLAPLDRWGRMPYGLAAASLALATALNLAGRTGAPLCDPSGLMQGHAAWHLLGALAVGAFAVPFLEREEGLNRRTPTAVT